MKQTTSKRGHNVSIFKKLKDIEIKLDLIYITIKKYKETSTTNNRKRPRGKRSVLKNVEKE